MRLKSEKLQRDFENVGAVRIPSFLNQTDIKRIVDLFSELNINSLSGIYSNVKDQSPEYNHKVDEIFREIYQESIEKHFTDYKVGGGAFLIKGTGEESHSSLHQDWNVVDESKYQSAAIFCPTVDVNEHNGCLQVIKGSHKWFSNVRSFHTPTPFFNFNQVKKGLVSFAANAGDAIVFRHNVIHGSKPNYSTQIRVAAMVSLASKNANFLHYKKEGDVFSVLRANNKFFNEGLVKLYEGGKVDAQELFKVSINPEMILEYADFQTRYQQEFPKSLANRIAHFFKRKNG